MFVIPDYFVKQEVFEKREDIKVDILEFQDTVLVSSEFKV